MAKIRGIKPEFWTDENVVELTIAARLLFIGLWTYACDNGHLQDKSKQIKMRVLPTEEVNCAELLREIEGQGLITRADGWITIPNLLSHQKVHKRWFALCDKPDCQFPEGYSYGYSKGDPKPESTVEQPLNNGGDNRETTVDQPSNNGCSTADVDVDVDVDGELMVIEEQAGKPASRKRRLPDDFVPNDTNRRIAAERGLDLRSVFEQFADHHAAKGSTMLDWHRAFNTWLRNERPGSRPGSPPKPAESNASRWLALANEAAEAEGNVAPFRKMGGAS